VRPLGAGLVFTPRLLPLLGEGNGAASVIEVEPQTLWQLTRRSRERPYLLNRERLMEIAALPQPKLLHSVGLPVGGSRPHELAQLALVRSMADVLQPAWASDHLGFNSFQDSQGWASAGFFLPPLQVPETVSMAAARIGELVEALDRAVAFETGVNYLRPQPGETADGEFFRAVAETADCGILLDLHNVWTNDRNGRARAADVLARLPLERVWEIHFAGGMELSGYWLDAHSGAIPQPVLDLAAEWIPRMPNLGALVFEIIDEHVPALGLGGVERQLDALRALWTLRDPRRTIVVRRGEPHARSTVAGPVRYWEDTLGALAIGRHKSGVLADVLRQDAGLRVLQQLVRDSRQDLVAKGLRHTVTVLLDALGADGVRRLLDDFTRAHPPELFVSAEADAFARFLRGRDLRIPFLDEVLGFEHALIRAVLYGESSEIAFEHEPWTLLETLEMGRVPEIMPAESAVVVVSPE
jgi:uncharacterized protein (UPF0276 family)